jgi:hypothetical protein
VIAAAGVLRADPVWLRSYRRPVLALTVGPVLLVPLQPYGGEMLLRATLYTLPFLAILAAAAMLSRSAILGWRGRVVIIMICSLLGAVAVVGRYGNAHFDMFTPGEVQAVDALYQNARKGDMLIAGAHATPWRYRDYDVYKTTTLEDLCTGVDVLTCFDRIRGQVYRGDTHRGLLLVTRSNRVSLVTTGHMSQADLSSLEELLMRKPGVHILFDSPDARLYELTRLARS